MAWKDDMPEGEKIEALNERASDLRKLSLGVILLAKGLLMDNLEGDEGREVLKALKDAEEAFLGILPEDGLDRLNDSLKIVHARLDALIRLVEHLSRKRGI